jgi:hypothetical protein
VFHQILLSPVVLVALAVPEHHCLEHLVLLAGLAPLDQIFLEYPAGLLEKESIM